MGDENAPVLDGNGNPVDIPDDWEITDHLRLWFAGRVPAEDCPINIWHGAVRSGKTIASLLRFLVAVVAAPRNGLIFIVGRTIQTIERNILDPLMQPDGPFGPLSRYVLHTRGANTAVIFGRVVHLVGANDVRAESKGRLHPVRTVHIGDAYAAVYCAV